MSVTSSWGLSACCRHVLCPVIPLYGTTSLLPGPLTGEVTESGEHGYALPLGHCWCRWCCPRLGTSRLTSGGLYRATDASCCHLELCISETDISYYPYFLFEPWFRKDKMNKYMLRMVRRLPRFSFSCWFHFVHITSPS